MDAVLSIASRRVALYEYMGAGGFVHADTPVGRIVARVPADAAFAPGVGIHLTFDPEHMRMFAAKGQAL